jgi:hypothetical protein
MRVSAFAFAVVLTLPAFAACSSGSDAGSSPSHEVTGTIQQRECTEDQLRTCQTNYSIELTTCSNVEVSCEKAGTPHDQCIQQQINCENNASSNYDLCQAECGSSCTPVSCFPQQCGQVPDGCGGTNNCTDCCQRLTCQPGQCGELSDGCGGTINCGPCCQPLTCQPGQCGQSPDGCGGTLDCGPCCQPATCQTGQCGQSPDGCGGTLDCGPCCQPATCQPDQCGQIPDGCGGTLDCGVCGGGCGTGCGAGCGAGCGTGCGGVPELDSTTRLRGRARLKH